MYLNKPSALTDTVLAEKGYSVLKGKTPVLFSISSTHILSSIRCSLSLRRRRN